MKHRQRPKITIGASHGLMNQRTDRIHVSVPVRNHHALRTRGSAAGVVDRQQIAFANLGTSKIVCAFSQQRFVIQPPGMGPFEGDEVFDAWEL